MKCQEVTEWMQRYMDHDLNETETSLLMDHLSKCEHCPPVFERLELLSQELTQLPLVEPPYSIVDRIIPQLNDIERLDSPIQSVNSDHEDKEPTAGSRIIPLLKSRAFKTYTGIVAAAIILFAIFSNGSPFGLFDRQLSFDASNSGHRMLDSSSGASMNAAPQAVSEVLSESSADSAPQARMSEADLGEAVTEMTLNQSESLDAGDTNTNEVKIEHHASSTANFSDADSVSSMKEDDSLSAELDGQMMTISGMAVDQSLGHLSPDGQYKAIVEQEGKQIQIHIVNMQGEQMNSTGLFAAERLSNLRWSDDSRFIEFDHTEGERTATFKLPVIKE